MDMAITGRTSPALDEHIRARVSAAVDQYPQRIANIEVHLEDVNGPKGGVDQRCQIRVRLNPKGEVLVNHLAADPYEVVSQLSDRLRNAVSRAVGKLKEHG